MQVKPKELVPDPGSAANVARVAIQPGFVWDAQDAYLFDIDGTLLRSRDRIHVNSFVESVQRVTGFEVTLTGIVLQGSTDTGILREACNQAGIPAQVLQEHTEAILEAMGKTVADQRHALDLVRMPGVEEALRHLAKRGALLGVATGNLEMIGWIKVETSRAARVVQVWRLQRSFSDPVRIDRARGEQGPRDGGTGRPCLRGGRYAAGH